jgi:hypothetical protein
MSHVDPLLGVEKIKMLGSLPGMWMLVRDFMACLIELNMRLSYCWFEVLRSFPRPGFFPISSAYIDKELK